METKTNGWAWLDQLGDNVGQLANTWLTAELIKRTPGSSTPAVASVPNSTAARDTSAVPKSDPNAGQRYALWGAVGLGVVLFAVIASRALSKA